MILVSCRGVEFRAVVGADILRFEQVLSLGVKYFLTPKKFQNWVFRVHSDKMG